MTSQESNNTLSLDNATIENARIGYSSAINLWIYEGTLIWNKF